MIFLLTLNSYHQDVEDWKFGKLSALREIQLAIEGDYDYYYMGTFTNSKTALEESALMYNRVLHSFMY